MLCTIKLVDHTLGHQATLEKWGYSCQVVADQLHVEVEGIVPSTPAEPIDVSSPEAMLAACQAAKDTHQAFGYGSWFLMPDGDVMKGGFPSPPNAATLSRISASRYSWYRHGSTTTSWRMASGTGRPPWSAPSCRSAA